RAGQQMLDKLLVGLRVRVVDEGRHVLRGRRQPGEIEVYPADERHAVGFRRCRESGLAQLLEDKSVDRVAYSFSCRFLERGYGRSATLAKRPVLGGSLRGTTGLGRADHGEQ